MPNIEIEWINKEMSEALNKLDDIRRDVIAPPDNEPKATAIAIQIGYFKALSYVAAYLKGRIK
jgi:hypothetical protein